MAASSSAREEVFETPDLPPELEPGAQRPLPEELLLQEQQHQDPEGAVVPTPLNADAAFEVFHGKRYETRGLPGASAYSIV